MKKNFILICSIACLCCCYNAAFTQGAHISYTNAGLSDVSAVAVNQNLIPKTNNKYNLGSNALAWKNLYLSGAIYSNDGKTIMVDGKNIAFGLNTLVRTQGYSNIAFGNHALFNNTWLNNNIAIGDSSLFSFNDGFGSNTAVGSKTLYSDIAGYANTAIGLQSLYSNTNGNDNVAIGEQSLYSNTTGTFNTASGTLALNRNTTGGANTATGFQALYLNKTGQSNTAVGSYAGIQSNADGNTSVGYSAGGSAANGDNNTFVGCFALAFDDGLTNSGAFGYSSRITASNQVRIGNSNITSIGGYVNWSNISDGRYKKNIKNDVPGLAFINDLKPLTYTLDIKGINHFLSKNEANKTSLQKSISDKLKIDDASLQAKEQIIYSGFVAQEVEATARKLHYNFSGVDAPKNTSDLYGLRYSDFVVPLVKAVQELSKENNELKDENAQLKSRIEKIEAVLFQSQVSSNMQALAADDLFSANSAKLESVIPNPFKGSTVIRYTIPAGSNNAGINIYAASGSLIKSLHITSAGSGQVTLNAADLPAGNYNCLLLVNAKVTDSRQLVVVK